MKKLLLGSVVALSLLTGCGAAGRAALGFAVGTAIVASAQDEPVRVVYEPPPGYMLVPVPGEPIQIPDPPEKRPERGPQFQYAAARNMLGAVNVDDCRVHGLPEGYGHARVVFAPNGHVLTVAIDAPSGLETDALTCVGDKLGAVTVPEFDGAPMTVGTQWLAH